MFGKLSCKYSRAPQFILFVFVTCWYGNISSLIKLSIALLFLSGLWGSGDVSWRKAANSSFHLFRVGRQFGFLFVRQLIPVLICQIFKAIPKLWCWYEISKCHTTKPHVTFYFNFKNIWFLEESWISIDIVLLRNYFLLLDTYVMSTGVKEQNQF